MTKPIFTVEDFLKFCKTKDPSDTYVYADFRTCACAQYAAQLGMSFAQASIASHGAFDYLNTLAEFKGRARYPVTFGELVKKLEAITNDR